MELNFDGKLQNLLKIQDLDSIAQEIIQNVPSEFASYGKQEVLENGNLIKIDNIIQACYFFDSVLASEVVDNINNFNPNKKNKITNIILLGTKLIFQLREIITSESIDFTIGGSTASGVLKEKTYRQEVLFDDLSNLRVSFSRGAIELNSALVSLKELDESKSTLAEQWKLIEKFGFIKNKEHNQQILIRGEDGELYQKKSPDLNVYMKYITSTKRKSLTYYYNTNNIQIKARKDLDNLLSYDRGWVYQWAKSLGENLELEESQTPLRPLMNSKFSFRDTKPGIKGGDDNNTQYKFRARRLITFQNIRNILKGGKGYLGIIPTLEELKRQIMNPSEDVFIKLYQDFTTYNKEEIKNFIKNSSNFNK